MTGYYMYKYYLLLSSSSCLMGSTNFLVDTVFIDEHSRHLKYDLIFVFGMSKGYLVYE